MFLKYVSGVTATSLDGIPLSVETKNNNIEIGQSRSSYILRYTYNVPQKISGEIDQSLPVLNDRYGRFDNNLTFLTPEGMADAPAELMVSAPFEWRIATSWGLHPSAFIPKVSQLISGMIVIGDYEFSESRAATTAVVFAIKGDFSHEIIKDQFLRVLKSQQDIVGALPSHSLLAVFQPTVVECCKGTSLTNSVIINIPSSEKLVPFNFRVVGTASHELFHQWNMFHVAPASEEGAYLLTEGFTNYFAVAALVRSGLVPETAFARFLCKYRSLLEGNPRYPNFDYAAIQAGLAKDDRLLDLAYTKGPFVAVLLDIALREDTKGTESLASWFRALSKRFGGSKGYTVSDLRLLTAELSHKPHGSAIGIFDAAFLGGKALAIDELFVKLGISCTANGEYSLSDLPKPQTELRYKVFSAEN